MQTFLHIIQNPLFSEDQFWCHEYQRDYLASPLKSISSYGFSWILCFVRFSSKTRPRLFWLTIQRTRIGLYGTLDDACRLPTHARERLQVCKDVQDNKFHLKNANKSSCGRSMRILDGRSKHT